MQKILEISNIKLLHKQKTIISKEKLDILIPIVLKFVKNINTMEDLASAIEKEFNCICPIELIINYYDDEMQQIQLELMIKQCDINY
jgi:hypothetical protein